MIKFGISTGSFYPYLSTLQALKQVSNAGIYSVEIVLQGMDEHNNNFARQVSQLCADLDIKVGALHPRAEYFQKSDYTSYSDLFQLTLSMAKEMGADILVFHGPERNISRKERIAAAIGLCQMAIEANLVELILTLENTFDGFCQTPQEISEVISYDKDHNLMITLDLYKASLAGFSAENFIQTFSNRICHLHFCDQIPGIKKRLLPGEGNFPLFKTLSAVANTNPNILAILEAQEITDLSLFRRFVYDFSFR